VSDLHRDVAPRNVVLDAHLGALVCDLGVSREMASGKDYARRTVAVVAAAARKVTLVWAVAMDPRTRNFGERRFHVRPDHA
jgi:serine/threonine protein kinase